MTVENMEEVQQLRRLAAQDYGVFANLFFSTPEYPIVCYPHILEWIELLEESRKVAYDNRMRIQKAIQTGVPAEGSFQIAASQFLAPKAHLKTTHLSFIYPIWRIVRRRPIRIAIVNLTDELGGGSVRRIASELTENRKLIQVFGEFRPPIGGKWAPNFEITVLGSNLRERDSTVTGLGVGSGILGRRADLLIMDDPLDDKNTATQASREKTVDWINTVVINILEPWGELIVGGTAKHADDWYHHNMENSIENGGMWRCIKQRAIIDWEKKKVLFPVRWPFGALIARKKVIDADKPGSFDLDYQNEIPKDKNNRRLTQENIKDNCIVHVDGDIKEFLVNPGYIYFAGVDFSESDENEVKRAIRKGNDPDYFALAVVRVDKKFMDNEGTYPELCYLKRDRGFKDPLQDQVSIVHWIIQVLGKLLINANLEGILFQKLFYHALKKRIKQSQHRKLTAFDTRKSLNDPVLGEQSFRDDLKYGLIKILSNCPLWEKFAWEAEKSPDNNQRDHNDMFRAVWMAWHGYIDYSMRSGKPRKKKGDYFSMVDDLEDEGGWQTQGSPRNEEEMKLPESMSISSSDIGVPIKLILEATDLDDLEGLSEREAYLLSHPKEDWDYIRRVGEQEYLRRERIRGRGVY